MHKKICPLSNFYEENKINIVNKLFDTPAEIGDGSYFYLSKSFWKILERSGNNLEKLASILERVSHDQLIEYQYNYVCAVMNLLPFDEITINWRGTENYSPGYETIMDISAWIVSMGQSFYESVLINSDKYKDITLDWYEGNNLYDKFDVNEWETDIINEEYFGYQSPEGIAVAVYEYIYDCDNVNFDEVIEELYNLDCSGLKKNAVNAIRYRANNN